MWHESGEAVNQVVVSRGGSEGENMSRACMRGAGVHGSH